MDEDHGAEAHAAETLGALAQWLGGSFDEATLWLAWDLVMFNQTHDLASGVMTDHVYEDTLCKYESASRLADGLIDSAWDAVTSKINTVVPGTPVVVFNTLGWKRSDLVEVDLGFARGGVQESPSGMRCKRSCRFKSSTPRAMETEASRRRGSPSWRRTCRPWATASSMC